MKNNIAFDDTNINKVRNEYNTAIYGQHVFKKNRAGVKMPMLDKIRDYSEAQFERNASKIDKSKLCIKNMVSIRCIMVVKEVLENLGLHYTSVELGEVEILGSIPEQKRELLRTNLHEFGLELIEDNKNILVEKIKTVIIEMVHYEDKLPKSNFSDYLSKKLNHNYTYLSNLFTKVKGTSIEHYILTQKIERAKELMVYDGLTLSEIAWKLHYSSVAHLSNQFKKITGLTPSRFKHLKDKRFIALENL